MRLSGSSANGNRVTVELESGATVAIVDNQDGTLSISETGFRLLSVQPDARNMITLSFPLPAGVVL